MSRLNPSGFSSCCWLPALTIAVVGAVGGCRSTAPPVSIVHPGSAVLAPQIAADGSVPPRKYVIRMSDGRRDWEVEFPDGAGGYEMRIPLDARGEPGAGPVAWEAKDLTDADKQLLRELRRSHPEMEREGISTTHDPASAKAEPKGSHAARDKPANRTADPAAPSRPSYFLGIEEVNGLYRAGRFELAMVRLVDLEKYYPDDVKLLSMKGSLWLQLGRTNLARETWERVLQIDPHNKPVIESLKRLNNL